MSDKLQSWIDKVDYASRVLSASYGRADELVVGLTEVSNWLVANQDVVARNLELEADLAAAREEIERQRAINKTIAHDVQSGAEAGYRQVIDTLKSERDAARKELDEAKAYADWLRETVRLANASRRAARKDAEELAKSKYIFCDLDILGWEQNGDARFHCLSHDVDFVHKYGITACQKIDELREKYLPRGEGE